MNISVDASTKLGPVNHIWRFFGADEPNYAYMKNGKKLLHDLGEMRPGEVFFRAHNLLTTGNGTYGLKWGSTNIYTEDENGNPVYNWHIVDSIFDAYLENGVRPYVQMGFMPKALSSKPEPYRHYWKPGLPYQEVFTGWAYPPNDYNKWEELIYQWVKHCVEKYSRKEVEQWYWQTWNEPNIDYWQGTDEEFLKLHDYAVHGVLRALPTAKVGGADVAGPTSGSDVTFTKNFINHCLNGTNYASGEKGTQLDFLSFHAKGRPKFEDGHVRMGIWHQLMVIDRMFKTIQSIPEVNHLPIVIGESDPEGCAACQGENLGYRNGTMYSSYTAASFVRKLDLAQKYNVNLEGALTWAFEFENQPYFAGFRALSTNGINKPVLNVFNMFSMMNGQRVRVESDGGVPLEKIISEGVREKPDVSAYASFDGSKVYVMLWHYHDDDVPGPVANVSIQLENLPVNSEKAIANIYMIDETHSNSFTEWKRLGSPEQPSPMEYKKLEESSKLQNIEKNKRVKIINGQALFNVGVERQGVAMMVLELE